jgi:hypothetical protein
MDELDESLLSIMISRYNDLTIWNNSYLFQVHTNTHGLVDASTDTLGGLYVSGWLKRWPTGIIGTNIGLGLPRIPWPPLSTMSKNRACRPQNMMMIMMSRQHPCHNYSKNEVLRRWTGMPIKILTLPKPVTNENETRNNQERKLRLGKNFYREPCRRIIIRIIENDRK